VSAGCDPEGVDALYDLLAQPPVAYLILFAIAAGDAIFPALPSESAAILAGVLAAIEPGIALPAVLGAAAAGAFVGDSTSYGLGRFGGRRAQRRFFDGPHTRRGVRWACIQLRQRGATILVVARFVPGGRTGATFTSGLTAFHYGRFALYTGIAACLWALYAVLLGYFGGRIFHERPLLAFAVAFGLAVVIALLAVPARRLGFRLLRRPHRGADAEHSSRATDAARES
jgi:membrane-associated protein